MSGEITESVYIETTIPSLYTGRPSSQLVEAARQQLTHNWWDLERDNYQIVTSQTVIDECARGEKLMADKRVKFLEGIPLLRLTDDVALIAKELLAAQIIPMKAADDAIHIAVASVHEIDYLLTWNCKHLANPKIWWRVSDVVTKFGYKPSVICTPEDLIGDDC
ncbi:MAG: type II toxin-antitoxin system VapC family toxin [Verrucomicrobiota bacterium]